jgi:uncharacterized protein (TIGR02145 family)
MRYSTAEGAQGICPNGWHIPTDAEWYALESSLKDSGELCDAARGGRFDCFGAGTKLMQGGSSGMYFQLAGSRVYVDGSFYSRNKSTSFWSSTVKEKFFPWVRGLDSGNTRVTRGISANTNGFSVRCLKSGQNTF